MYESFFNLAIKPFDLLPNPEFLFLSKSHLRAVNKLDYAIRERIGFILLTGDIGSGKTTIIRDLIKKTDKNILISRVFNTKVDFEQLLCMINEDFGIPVKSKEKCILLRELNEFLIDRFSNGDMPVLVIDEAQNLTPETLEEIRMLSNLETDDAKLLQIILVGQPELRRTIALPELLQLRQRISFYCHINPLEQEEVEQYILHRLEIAGNRRALFFPRETIAIIWRYSRGIPRLINIICEFMLLSAFAEGVKEISAELAKEIVGDLDFENQYWGTLTAQKAKEESVVPAVGTKTRDNRFYNKELQELLNQAIYRVEVLEKKDKSNTLNDLEDFQRRLVQYDQTVNLHMSNLTRELEELKKDVQAKKPLVSVDPAPAVVERKKMGLLRYLFRAV